MVGKSSQVLFLFALGLSLLPLSSAALASYYRAPARPLWTTVGALLAAYRQHLLVDGEMQVAKGRELR